MNQPRTRFPGIDTRPRECCGRYWVNNQEDLARSELHGCLELPTTQKLSLTIHGIPGHTAMRFRASFRFQARLIWPRFGAVFSSGACQIHKSAGNDVEPQIFGAIQSLITTKSLPLGWSAKTTAPALPTRWLGPNRLLPPAGRAAAPAAARKTVAMPVSSAHRNRPKTSASSPPGNVGSAR